MTVMDEAVLAFRREEKNLGLPEIS
jgi:hypothetical protein